MCICNPVSLPAYQQCDLNYTKGLRIKVAMQNNSHHFKECDLISTDVNNPATLKSCI